MRNLHSSTVRQVLSGSILCMCSLSFALPPSASESIESAPSISSSGREAGVTETAVMSDESFAKAAALSNLGELESSRVALERSRNLRVKLLADRIVQDRSSIAATLEAAAKKRNVKLPTKMGIEQQAVVSALKLQPNESFDTAYVRQMREENVKTIALFEQAKNSSALSPEIRELAGAGLKILLASQQQTLIIEVPVKAPKVVGDPA